MKVQALIHIMYNFNLNEELLLNYNQKYLKYMFNSQYTNKYLKPKYYTKLIITL